MLKAVLTKDGWQSVLRLKSGLSYPSEVPQLPVNGIEQEYEAQIPAAELSTSFSGQLGAFQDASSCLQKTFFKFHLHKERKFLIFWHWRILKFSLIQHYCCDGSHESTSQDTNDLSIKKHVYILPGNRACTSIAVCCHSWIPAINTVIWKLL